MKHSIGDHSMTTTSRAADLDALRRAFAPIAASLTELASLALQVDASFLPGADPNRARLEDAIAIAKALLHNRDLYGASTIGDEAMSGVLERAGLLNGTLAVDSAGNVVDAVAA